jgi:hypothetical protein
LTYFQNDGTHPNQASHYNILTPIFQRGINRFWGNRDFSSATVYTSAAAAATPTTAGSESGNTATITFATTPANCNPGSTINISGATPTGYNGNFFVLTRSSTQVTYYNYVPSLGVITVQGTGVCPQQQDADMYSVLNFGPGNFTLESCEGYTGQNIYIKNINSASTIKPFSSSEQIDGAGSLSILQNQTVALQAALISASAGGCNWRQIQ